MGGSLKQAAKNDKKSNQKKFCCELSFRHTLYKSEGYLTYMTEILLRYALDMPEIYLRYT